MHKTIEIELDAQPHAVYDIVADLGTYAAWLELVSKVTPAERVPSDPGPAWTVTLRATVGPLARSKRLRMVRVQSTRPRHVRFERAETDGRRHAPWVLDSTVSPVGGGVRSHLRVDLSYGGRLWSSPLEAVLGSQVDSAILGLRGLVEPA